MITRPAVFFFLSAGTAALVSLYGVADAWLTVRALDRSERWRNDSNARLLAHGGVRTAALRALQMFGMMYGSVVAMQIDPKPSVADALMVVWLVFAATCWVSALKEVLAIRDRGHIKPEGHA
jgi:MFS superfamily sulfate permease-like transporter